MADLNEDDFSVIYRPKDYSKYAYDEAIEALRGARDEDPAACCGSCGDTGHTAVNCHHNPLVMARRAVRSQEKWRCFHCNGVFRTSEEAEKHFGETHDEHAKCLTLAVLNQSEVIVQALVSEWTRRMRKAKMSPLEFVALHRQPVVLGGEEFMIPQSRADDCPDYDGSMFGKDKPDPEPPPVLVDHSIDQFLAKAKVETAPVIDREAFLRPEKGAVPATPLNAAIDASWLGTASDTNSGFSWYSTTDAYGKPSVALEWDIAGPDNTTHTCRVLVVPGTPQGEVVRIARMLNRPFVIPPP